ncbi:MAG: hypothetical protein QFX32_04870 [Methanolinea sp.]|nr:hypothetical protein [Methanolinea sp.]
MHAEMGRAGGRRFPAPVNDQWDFLLSTIWDQMIHLVAELPGRLDEARLSRAMGDVLEAEPVLRSRFVDAEEPFWEEIPRLSPRAYFSLVRARDAGSAAGTVPSRTRIDPRTGPQARLTLVRGGEDVLVLSVNHAASDACGVKETAALLAQFYREGGGAARARGLDLPDRSFAPVLSAFTPAEREAARRACGEGTAEWGIPCTPENARSPRHATARIGPGLFLEIRKYARSRGMTVNDLLLSAFFRSVAREIPHGEGKEYPVLVSADLRRLAPTVRLLPVANLSVAFEVRLPADGTLPPAAHADLAHRAMAEKKGLRAPLGAAIRLGEMFSEGFSRVREILEERKRASLSGNYPRNPFFSNAGVIPGECADFGELSARYAYLLPPVEYPPGFSVAASTYRDTLTLASGFCGDGVRPAMVGRILSGMGECLRDLVSPPP